MSQPSADGPPLQPVLARPAVSLEVLPYQRLLAEYLATAETAVWNWLAEAQQQAAADDAIRLEILKSTYRLETGTHGALYATAGEVAQKLGLDLPVTFYQSLGSGAELNARVYLLPNEAHIVLQGPVLEVLQPLEQRALIGHELGHLHLRAIEQGRMAIVDRVVQTLAADRAAESSHIQTAIHCQLYAEIYADRASWIATESVEATIGCLVKTSSGLRAVNPAAYLAQAREILATPGVVTERLTHPETFIRAAAIDRWVRREPGMETGLRRLIEGGLRLHALDLLGQQALTGLTRRLVNLLLAPRWMRSDGVMAHARQLFPDFTAPEVNFEDAALAADLEPLDAAARDYLCFLMLDFAAVDSSLEDLPLAHAMVVAERFDLGKRLEELAHRELRIAKKALAKLQQDRPAMLAKAALQ